jgi:hypothetical protein
MTSVAQNAWYEAVEGGTLEQGDLLLQCPVFVPHLESFPLVENQDVDIFIQYFDVIVMTQSCDLENGKTQDVVLCAHWDLEGAKKHDPALARSGALSEIKSGRRPRYTLLNRSEQTEPALGLRIVDCGKVFCLPLTFVQSLAVQQGPRLRLLSPYREHLSQAFARFFMRVGLPQDIELETR